MDGNGGAAGTTSDARTTGRPELGGTATAADTTPCWPGDLGGLGDGDGLGEVGGMELADGDAGALGLGGEDVWPPPGAVRPLDTAIGSERGSAFDGSAAGRGPTTDGADETNGRGGAPPSTGTAGTPWCSSSTAISAAAAAPIEPHAAYQPRGGFSGTPTAPPRR